MRNGGVGSWVERWARNAPHRVAMVTDERAWTYAELAARTRRLANALRARGIHKGDRVAWKGPNHPAFLETLFAAGQIGAVLVTINHRRDDAAIARMLERSGAKLVIGSARIGEPVLAADADYEELVASGSEAAIDEAVELDDPCMLAWTSGTTSDSKGVMLTHGNVTWNVVNVLSCADIRTGDVTIAIAPFFRVGGTGVNVLPILFKGGTVVVPTGAGVDDPAGDLLSLIERHRVTVGFGNPDLLDAMMRSPRWSSVDLSSVRFVMTGGAPVPERLIRAYLERGVTLLQGYGLSETAPVALLLDAANALAKVGAAGRPPLLVDVRVVRKDGAAAAVGETGELHVRGPNVMKGYWNDADATRAAIDEDGWLRTGDVARMDADGDFWIVDRAGDEIESQGAVVYPGDVERVLLEHAAVADAAVAGIEGAPVAFVVLAQDARATADELIELCRGSLAAPAVPSAIRFVASVPRNTVGKLLRRELAKR